MLTVCIHTLLFADKMMIDIRRNQIISFSLFVFFCLILTIINSFWHYAIKNCIDSRPTSANFQANRSIEIPRKKLVLENSTRKQLKQASKVLVVAYPRWGFLNSIQSIFLINDDVTLRYRLTVIAYISKHF